MHVGLITYQWGHLKTFQLLQKLMIGGHRVTLFAFPFQLRESPPPIFADRPYQILDMDIAAFCRRYGIGWVPVGGWSDDHASALGAPGHADTPDVFMTCIAKIIPASFIQGRTILNCHPGLLPQNRGVDAFKWAVVNGWPVGVTLHAIDAAIDRGVILKRVRIPILPDDTLPDVCQRAYDIECDLMAQFDRFLPNLGRGWAVGDDHPLSRRRLPAETDHAITDIFRANQEVLMQVSTDLSAQPHESDRV